MKRILAGLALALAAAPLAGCYDDGYGRAGLVWSSYPYAGWYDGYYGSIYDGYWGTDNSFYYRRSDRDRNYYRDRQNHFRRGEGPPGDRFHRFEGMSRQPGHGTRLPNYPRGDGGHDGGGHDGGGRGHHDGGGRRP